MEYVAAKKHQLDELKNTSDEELEDIFAQVLFPYFSLTGPYQGTRDDRARLRVFTSQLVGRYINGLKLQNPQEGKTVHADDGYRKEIALLKQLTWFYVIDAPARAAQQHAQRQMIKYLFRTFLGECRRSPARLLPPYYRERLSDADGDTNRVKRIVADLIAGMTESQALLTYQRLNGIVNGSALDKLMVG